LGAHHQAEEGDAQHSLPDAAPRPEHRRLQALPGRHPGEVRQERLPPGHRRLPHLRRAQRPAQHADGHALGQEVRRGGGGSHLLYHLPGAHHRRVCRLRPQAAGDGSGHALHQGHGGDAGAHGRLRTCQAAPGGDRAAGASALPCHLRHGHGHIHEGDRGGGGDRGHRDLQHVPGHLPAPDGGRGGDAAGHGVRHRAGPQAADRDLRLFPVGAEEVPRLRERVHRHRHQCAGVPDPGGNDLQPHLPAAGGEEGGPAGGRVR